MFGRRLNRSRLNQERFDDPIVSPMEGLQNLADAMLVLAVGIMLALVIHWNLDIYDQQSEGGTGSLDSEKLEGVESVDPDKTVKLDQLEELGRGVIYIDPDTGEAYLFAEE